MNKAKIAELKQQQRQCEKTASAALKRGDVVEAVNLMAQAKNLACDVLAAETTLLSSALATLHKLPVVKHEPFDAHERNGHTLTVG